MPYVCVILKTLTISSVMPKKKGDSQKHQVSIRVQANELTCEMRNYDLFVLYGISSANGCLP
jgi:hypothetical protein